MNRLPHPFTGAELTQTLSRIEGACLGVSAEDCGTFLNSMHVDREALGAAAKLKQLASQIDMTIHALGILLCLPYILKDGETIEYISLGAGNTGRQFDLETNVRVAEFKFIAWKGGSESIRQTSKRKHLYLLGTRHALSFLQGGRALKSVLSRNNKISEGFFERFSNKFRTVREYYTAHRDKVEIEDVSPLLPELT